MLDFTYNNPVRIHFGRESLEKLPKEIRKHGTKVLLVYGGSSLKSSGNYDRITGVLRDNGISHSDFGGNTRPLYTRVLEAVGICRRENIDVVLGIGGSVCMDMAKIIGFGALNDNLWDYLSGKTDPKGRPMLTVGEIPTFPSGGSEVDAAGEIEEGEDGERGSLYGMFPDFAILNPELTYSVGRKETAYGALVAFAQVYSSYFGGSSRIAEGFSETVMKAILENLEIALENPLDYDARANLMWASTVNTSGVLNSGKLRAWSLYGCETIAEELFKVSYRQAVAVIFPKWLRGIGKHYSDTAYSYAVNVMGVDADGKKKAEVIEEGIAATEEMYAKFGIAVTFNEIAEVPEKPEIMNELDRFEDDDVLSREEVRDIILGCIR